MQEDATLTCPWCGEPVEVELDASAGSHQRYVEDCWVCCHPCVVSVDYDEAGEARVAIEQE